MDNNNNITTYYNKFPHLTIKNFTTNGDLSSDINLDTFSRRVNPNSFSGVSFVLFYSKGCCENYLKCFSELHSKLPKNSLINVYGYDVAQSGTLNNTIFSVLSNAPYRILGYPYLVVFYNGHFCSVYKPDNLPTADILQNELIKYAQKLLQNKTCITPQ